MNPKPFVQNNYNIASLQLERLVVLLVPIMLCLKYCNTHAVACMTGWLTPRTSDLEVRGSSLTRHVVSFRQGTLLQNVSLHPLSPRCINGYWRQTAGE